MTGVLESALLGDLSFLSPSLFREAAGLSFLFSNIFFFAELLSFAFLFSADEVNLVFFLMSFLVNILPFLGVVLPFLATTLDFSFGACFSSELEELESLLFLEPLDTLAFFLGGVFMGLSCSSDDPDEDDEELESDDEPEDEDDDEDTVDCCFFDVCEGGGVCAITFESTFFFGIWSFSESELPLANSLSKI